MNSYFDCISIVDVVRVVVVFVLVVIFHLHPVSNISIRTGCDSPRICADKITVTWFAGISKIYYKV